VKPENILGKLPLHSEEHSQSRIIPSEVLKEKLYEHPCTSISRVLGLRTSHESSSPLWKCNHRVFPPDCNIHTHILPQSHIRGRYPSRAVYELILSLNHATYHQLGYGLASHLKLIKRKTLSIPNRMIMQKQLN